jgi:hypothetical protein
MKKLFELSLRVVTPFTFVNITRQTGAKCEMGAKYKIAKELNKVNKEAIIIFN